MYVDVNSVGNIFISRWASYELTLLANEPDAGMSRLCVVCFLIFLILHSVLVMNRGNGMHFYSYDSDISCYAVMGK